MTVQTLDDPWEDQPLPFDPDPLIDGNATIIGAAIANALQLGDRGVYVWHDRHGKAHAHPDLLVPAGKVQVHQDPPWRNP